MKSFKYWQWRTIIATMIGYALFYFVRKNFSFAMPGLAAEYAISNTSFGIILTIVGLVYGLSRFFNGIIADRMNGRYHMSIGLLLCALTSLAFGFIPSLLGVEIGVAPHALIVCFGVLLVLNNIFQGSGFPPVTRLLTHWVPPHELATKMSIWNTSHSIGAGLLAILCGFIMGNMGSNLSTDEMSVDRITRNYITINFKDDIKKSDQHIASVDRIKITEQDNNLIALVDYSYKPNYKNGETVKQIYYFDYATFCKVRDLIAANKDISTEQIASDLSLSEPHAKAFQSIVTRTTNAGAWRWCFYLPAFLALLGAFGLFTALRDTPKSVGLEELQNKTSGVNENSSTAEHRAFVRKKVYGNPLIWILAIANFFVYVVRFAALDWGPTMLTESKGLTLAMATTLCIVFEFIGGNIGMVFWGWLTDKFFKSKAHQTCVLCMAGAAASVAVFWAIPEGTAWWIQILPFTFIGFFVYGPQALLGISAANQATNRAAATANGILGIFGYASTLISGVGFGYVAQHYGWNGAYLTILIMSLLGVVTLLTMWNAPANGYED